MALKKSNYDPAAKFGATPNMENVTAAITLVDEWSGRNVVLNAAAGFAVTLPDPNSGDEFTFLVKTPPTAGSYTVVATGAIIKGGMVNSAAGAGSTTTGGTTITFAQNQALAGDWVKIISDGTYWYLTGYSAVAAGITVA